MEKNGNSLLSIGISACLTGQLVRYDGKHKRFSELLDRYQRYVSWQPFCPEVEAGLGTPRPPVQLIEIDSRIYAKGVENNSLDVTDSLQAVSTDYWSRQHLERRVSGYIFKARSPSCGLGSTAILNSHQESLHHGSGLFATHCPLGIAAVEETWFKTPQHFARFLAATSVAQAIQKGCVEPINWLSRYLIGSPSTDWVSQLLEKDMSAPIKEKAALDERLSEIWP